MSILLSGRIKIALSVLTAAVAFLFIPASAGANTCGVMANSFHCMSGMKKKKRTLAKKAAYKKKTAKKSYKVAAVRPTKTVTDADLTVAQPKRASKASKSSRRKVRRLKKARVSRRTVRRMKSTRRTKRALRRKSSRSAKLHTIGRRIDAKSVRKLTKSGLSKRASKKSSRRSAKASSKRGWRTRGKSLGYRTANRGVSTSCFPARLKKLLRKISAHYGRKLVITSGYRSHRHNRRIGGARRSQHVHCTAADFYIPGVNKYSLARYMKRLPGRGGVGTYSGNRTVHLDVGPRRSWHWGRKKKRRAGKRRYRRSATVARRTAARRRSAKRRVARLRGSKI